jgi:uncharacterized protein with HEPN domain
MRPDRGDPAYLQDMLDAGEAIVRYVAGKSREDYDSNEMLRDAVERRIEIFGEAARRLSSPLMAAHPEIPWRKIMGTRHILAHDYDTVDPDMVWRIATQHIPEALVQIRPLIPPPPPEQVT